jgi:hypothetical protein
MPRLVDALEKIGWPNLESSGKPHDRREARFANPSFQAAHFRWVKPGSLCECLLGHAQSSAAASDLLAQALARLHKRRCSTALSYWSRANNSSL